MPQQAAAVHVHGPHLLLHLPLLGLLLLLLHLVGTSRLAGEANKVRREHRGKEQQVTKEEQTG